MFYDYYEYYGSPVSRFGNGFALLLAAAVLAVIAGIVLFLTFLNKKHEGKYHGFKGKLYNFLNFNRFYAEGIVRFLYVITVCVLVLVGAAQMILGLDAGSSVIFWLGAGLLVLGNLAARICCELVMMFIILCRKTVSVDRRLSKMESAFTFTEEDADDGATMKSGADAEAESEIEDAAPVEKAVTEDLPAAAADPEPMQAEEADNGNASEDERV